MASTVLGTGKQLRTRQMRFWMEWSAVLVAEDQRRYLTGNSPHNTGGSGSTGDWGCGSLTLTGYRRFPVAITLLHSWNSANVYCMNVLPAKLGSEERAGVS